MVRIMWKADDICACAVNRIVLIMLINVLIQINILMSALTLVRCDNSELSTSSSGKLIYRTSTLTKDDMKKKSISTIVPNSSKSSTAKHSSSSVTSNTAATAVSSGVINLYKSKMVISSSRVVPTTSFSVHSVKDTSLISSEITPMLSSSLNSMQHTSKVLLTIHMEASRNNSLTDFNIATSNLFNVSSTIFTNRSKTSPSLVLISTIITNSTALTNISTSTPPMNLSTPAYSTATLNSTLFPSPVTSVSSNTTSSVYTGNSSWFTSTFVPSSTLVCPTTTIYINCSSDYFTITPTPSVINFTSSAVNVTSSFNISSIHVVSSGVSIINFTSSLNATSILTSVPTMLSTLAINSTSSIPAQISSIINITSTSTIIYSSAQIIIPPLRKCDVFLSEFTDAHSELSKCILKNMHPMRVCSNCSAAYETFSKNHKKIFKDCGEVLIYDYNMQYQVIPKMFVAQDMTWKSLECDKCYHKDESGINHYSRKFKDFIELYNDLNRCFKNHTRDSWIRSANTTIRNTTYDAAICTNCYDLYHEMQVNYEYYGDNGEDSPTEWCADINVAVNETRHRWSNDFKCGKKEKDLESVIALTCFFCFLPIVFYVGAKLHADVRERKSANRYNYDSE